MPATLLRLAIGAIAMLVMFAAAIVLGFADASPGLLAAGAFSTAFLILPPLLGGLFVSYWAWEGEASRRLRTTLIVLVAVQALAVVGFVMVVVRLSAPAGWGVLAAGVLSDPILLLLGQAARRRDVRSDDRPGVADVRSGIRRAWRRGGIGGAVGLVVGFVLSATVGGMDEGSWDPVSLLFGPLLLVLGASICLSTGSLAVARAIRGVLGQEYSVVRRIGRAVNGKAEDLSDEEAARASIYASVAPSWLRLQVASQLAGAIGSAAVFTMIAISDQGLRWLVLVAVGISVAGASTAVVALSVQARRIGRFAASHPVPAD